MKCPECLEEGRKSKVFMNGPEYRTAMYYQPFYDEDGVYHHHDGNITTSSYRCSNHHRWQVKSTGKCHCGWGQDERS